MDERVSKYCLLLLLCCSSYHCVKIAEGNDTSLSKANAMASSKELRNETSMLGAGTGLGSCTAPPFRSQQVSVSVWVYRGHHVSIHRSTGGLAALRSPLAAQNMDSADLRYLCISLTVWDTQIHNFSSSVTRVN